MGKAQGEIPRQNVAPCAPEPTPTPSSEGSEDSGARRQFPSWEGSGVGQFRVRVSFN